MSDLPTVTGKEAVAAFQQLGFEVARQKGSHLIMKKQGHPHLLTVPVHAGKDLKPGLLRSLIRSAGISVDDFLAALG